MKKSSLLFHDYVAVVVMYAPVGTRALPFLE